MMAVYVVMVVIAGTDIQLFIHMTWLRNKIEWNTEKNYFLHLAYLQILHSSREMRNFGDWMIPSSVDGGSQSFTTLLVTPAVANIPSAPTYATRLNTAFLWIK